MDEPNFPFEKMLTIAERVADVRASGTANKSSLRNLEEWTQRKTSCEKIVAKKLEANGWDPQEFDQCIAKDYTLSSRSAEELAIEKEFQVILHSPCSQPSSGSYAVLMRPFLDMFERSVDNIRMSFSDRIEGEAVASLADSLAERLMSISIKAFLFEMHRLKIEDMLVGDTPEDRFKDFLSKAGQNESVANLYRKYPVLARKLKIASERYIEYVIEMGSNISSSWHDICSELGVEEKSMICEISISNGDIHGRGRTVAILRLGKKKLVYKPRDLRVEKNFRRIVDFFSQSEGFLDLRIPDTIYRDDHAFVEFVEHRSCCDENAVKGYYERFGQLIALLYLCNGGDAHYENVIADGEHPVLIDMETLFASPIEMAQYGSAVLKSAQVTLRDSVMSSALLPVVVRIHANGGSVDLSALNGMPGKFSIKQYALRDLNTDKARYEFGDVTLPSKQNVVLNNGCPVDYRDYQSEILNGFERVAKHFINQKGQYLALVKGLNDYPIRILARETNKYASILDFTYHPDCLSDFIEVEKVLESLYYFPYKNACIAKSEYEQMLFDDIPMFLAGMDSVCVKDGSGDPVGSVLECSPRENLLRKLESIDEEAIAMQASIISMLVGANDPLPYKIAISNRHEEAERYLICAVELAQRISGSAITDYSTHESEWIGLRHKAESDFEIAPLSKGYYDGLAGIAVMYKALFAVTEEKTFETMANNAALAMAELPNEGPVDSAFSGNHSVLTTCGLFDPSDYCYEMIEHSFSTVDCEPFRAYEEKIAVDWINGLSGLIPLYLKLYKSADDIAFLMKAEELAYQVINHWKTDGDLESRVGLGHGIPGLLVSIGMLYDETKDELYFDFISEASNTLCSIIAADDANFNTTWCNGAIGLLLCKAYLESIGIDLVISPCEQELLAEIEETHYETDCLCHGNAGRINFYLDLWLLTGIQQHYCTAMRFAEQMVNSIMQEGIIYIESYGSLVDVGMFNGLAGIVYTLLRVSNPESVKSPFMV